MARDVAVKIWMKLRERDRRDKFQKGIPEARKPADADNSDVAVRIHEAGDIGCLFYTTMEYFDGITVREWLVPISPSAMGAAPMGLL